MPKDVAPYGSWNSPITAETLARGSVTLSEPTLGTEAVSWVESRPLEGGRQVIVRASLDGSRRADAMPEGVSARTRVHEYGGGVYTLHGDTLFFSNDEDGRVYRVRDGALRAVSPEPAEPRSLRYADFDVAPDGGRVLCVRESHERDGEPVNEIVSLTATGRGCPAVVATGHDFYAAPRVSPDGTRLAWIAWDHPRMPWDGTELWTSSLDGSDAQLVAGGPHESIVQPAWSPAGVLHWVSDRSGWWNLYRDGEPLHPAEAEFGAPLWVFGQSTYAFLDDGRIACAWSSRAFGHLGVLDPEAGELEEIEVSHTPSFHAAKLRSDGHRVAYVGDSPTRAPAVVVVDTADGALTVVAQSTEDEPGPGYLSMPEAMEYPSGSGRTAHALFYPPRNCDYEAPEDEPPPLIVLSHGGPTSQAEPGLDLRTQFWTSRGFAVVDVNYGGSTGYGREYRELLRGQWGVVDLEDCTEAALHLARTGRADGARLAIRGGSAGGYTTLCALCFTDAFHVGASYYGVADIEALFGDTHKFESQYEYALVPLEKARERSPIHYVDQISAPVILFQGLDDPVVPPAQSERIAAALAERGVDYELHEYEGESHGFRKAETIIDSLESELAFYARVLVITPA